ncbi:MAG: TonB-dependent receptor [Sulfurimonadaceae bacterium]
MIYNKLFLPLLALSISLLGVELDLIEVNSKAYESQRESYDDLFNTPEYIESPQYVPAMPSQKRMTKEEAMFVPGGQGDPLKALQSLSGVTALGDLSGELYIYGSKPEETLTTINHLPIGYLFHMGGLHSVIAPEAIDQIDAYLAGFDVTYGNAMGGVIDITPAYPKDDLSGFGHVGLFDASAGINVALSDDVSFYFGARRSYFDLLLGAVGKATGTLDEDTNTTYTEFPNYYDITFMGTYVPNDNNIYSLELISADDALEVATQANAVKDPEATGQIKSHRAFTTVGLRHQSFYGDYESNTLLYYKYSLARAKIFDGYFVDVVSHEGGLYHQSSYVLDNHKFVAGVQLQHLNTPIDLNISSLPSSSNPDFDFTTADKFLIKEDIVANAATLFIEDIYHITPDFVFRPGLRFAYSDYKEYDGYVDPRLSLLYALSPRDNISFATGIYTQTPTGIKTIEQLGNPDLGYERAAHYVLHYDRFSNDGGVFSIDGFYKDYFDLVVDDNSSQYLNGGKGYAYGLDTNYKLRYENYYAYAAYTYIRSKRQLNTNSSELERFYGEIPHTFQMIGGVRFWKDWLFSTRLNYHSGAPYTKVIGTYTDPADPANRVRPIYETPNSSRLPDYFSLNLKIAQQLSFSNDTKLEWSFELMNVTNHENISGINYDDDYNEVGYYKQLPLLPWFDLTYYF